MHPPNPTAVVTAVTSCDSPDDPPMVLLHTASVSVISCPERIPARLFLDVGSSATFIHPELVKNLAGEQPIEKARMGITMFSEERELAMNRFRITLESIHDAQRVDISA